MVDGLQRRLSHSVDLRLALRRCLAVAPLEISRSLDLAPPR